MAGWILLLVFTPWFTAAITLQEEMPDFTVFTGEEAVIPCGHAIPNTGQLEFYNTEFTCKTGTVPPQENKLVQISYPKGVVSIEKEGYDANGTTGHLIILSAGLHDDTTFTCLKSYYGMQCSYSTLDVYVSPSNMTIQTYNETTPVEAVEGKLSDIECVVGSVKPADITVKWSISGEEIKVDESPGHVTNNDDGSFRVVSKLKYDKFVKRHAGKLLTCEAIHGEDPNYTNTVRERLTVFYQDYTTVKDPGETKRGSSLTLQCEIKPGTPPGTGQIYWYVNKTEITGQDGKYKGWNTKNLTVNDLQIGDEGEYTCKSANEVGEGIAERGHCLRAMRPPTGTPKIVPEDSFILAETLHILTCDLSSCDRGWPVASLFTWWKNETLLQGETRETLRVIEGSVSDNVGYRCQVENKYDSSNLSNWRNIIVGAPAKIEGPHGNLSYQPVMSDKDFSFSFNVSGTNLQSFIIKNGSQTLNDQAFTSSSSTVAGDFSYGQTSATTVTWTWDVTGQDLTTCENVTYYNGNYTFVAYDKNPVSPSSDSAEFIIEVFYRPLLSESGKSIGSPLNISLDLECQACASPPPYGYSWKYKGGTLPDGVVENGRFLEISNVTMDHFGNYTCSVYNNISGVEKEVHLNVELREEGAPHSIKGLEVTRDQITSRTIPITWANGLNGGLELLYHDIEYTMDESWRSINFPNCTEVGRKCEYRIMDMEPSSDYRIRVRPVNSHPTLSLGPFSYREAATINLPEVKLAEVKVTEEHLDVSWTYGDRYSSTSDVKVQVFYKEQKETEFRSSKKLDASTKAFSARGEFNPRRQYEVALAVFEKGLDEPTFKIESSSDPDPLIPMWGVVLIILIVVLILILVIAGVVCKVMRKRGQDEVDEGHDNSAMEPADFQSIEMRQRSRHNDYFTETEGGRKLPDTPGEDLSYTKPPAVPLPPPPPDPILEAIADDLREKVEDCMIDMSELEHVKKLGQGNFGDVFKYKWRQNGTYQDVAVKTLKENKSKDIETIEEFLWEGVLTYELRNPHVMSAHGVAVNDGRVYIILPFMGKGDLSLLLKHEDFTVSQLTGFCLDAAKGMRYMERKNYIHRDMAARNLMVDDSLRVRVADFGMASELLEKDYFRPESGRALPIRWMAPECLRGLKFSIKSDVWSFAVTMWEIYNKARKPYENYQNHYIKRLVTSERKYPDQELCPESVYLLMVKCWSFNDKDRPGFREIVRELEIIMANEDYFGGDYQDLELEQPDYVNEEPEDAMCSSSNEPGSPDSLPDTLAPEAPCHAGSMRPVFPPQTAPPPLRPKPTMRKY